MQHPIYDDIKIVEFTNFGVGPRTSSYFAAYGAEVVKVESTVRPDMIRGVPPYKGPKSINNSQLYTKLNSNKYGLSLNLKNPKGVELAKRLIARWANVVIENYTPGVMARLGLDYESLRKVKPDLIMLSSCMQGQNGPAREHPGFGIQLASLSGFNYFVGWPDRPPCGVFGPYTDMIAPLYNVLALLVAIDNRRITGQGQYLDVAQYECGVSFLSPTILDYFVNGRILERKGNSSERMAPHGVYPTLGEDKYVAIAVANDQEWNDFCQAIGNPELIQNPKFATLSARVKNDGELDRIIDDWTKNKDAREVMTLLQGMGVPCGVVNNSEGMYHDPQYKHDTRFREIPHPDTGTCLADANPLKLSKAPQVEPVHAPNIGEHTEFVCREILDLSDEEFSTLAQEGAFD